METRDGSHEKQRRGSTPLGQQRIGWPGCWQSRVQALLLGAAILAGLLAVPARILRAQDFIVPKALIDSSVWTEPAFVSMWQGSGQDIPGVVVRKYLVRRPPLFGMSPDSVSARFVGGEVDSLCVVLLDAGGFFGYQNSNLRGEAVPAARARFDAEFKQRKQSALEGLKALAKLPPQEIKLGTRSGLKWPATVFQAGNVSARLMAVEKQLVVVDFFKSAEAAKSLECGSAAGDPRRSRTLAEFRARVETSPNGDREIKGLPMLPQGNRGYCGVSTLAMVSHFLGLQPGAEEYAVSAGFKYGEGLGGEIRELCSMVAREAGISAQREGKFEYGRAKRSIDAGLPVVVFRRWSPERDYLHSSYASRLASGDASAALPAAGMEDRRSWPDRKAPAHSSIVHGYNDQRREVIFTESWGEAARSRRMRFEELEATSYYAIYFNL